MFYGQRLTEVNLQRYLNEQYYQRLIGSVEPLLQNDYGEDNDCTLTSITTMIHYWIPQLDVNVIYNQVEGVAKKYGYTGTAGTFPLFIRKIYQTVLNIFQLKYHVKSRYLKGTGFTWSFIKNQINRTNIPIVLNLWRDGRGYYSSHSVLIIGFAESKMGRMLAIYDNWYKTIAYIDYDRLNPICSIQYI